VAVPNLLRVNLESLVHGGEALGRTEGLVSFVDGGIPGETVEMAVRERRRSYVRGDVTQVLKASPDRVTPPCPYFGSCGGCQWQHLAYPAQLRAKRDILCDQLRRQGTQVDPEAIAVHGMADPWRYRIRGQFHVLRRGGTVSLGFYQRRTYRTLAIEDCLIHDARIVAALPAFGRALAAVGSGVRGLQLTVSPSRAELLWLGLPPGSAPPEVGARAGDELPALHVTDDSIGIEDDGRQFRLRNETFVQVNAQQMPRLYGLVVDALALQGSERVVDAYAGIGVLSARLAARAAEVWCLEEHPVAVRLGELNARVNGQANLRYLRGAVEKTLGQVPAPCHAVVLDPPRAGCEAAAVGALLRLRPARIVYISCDPASLARDLRRLDPGYAVEQLSVVDMFPQTYHVESVASLVARR
jgi:23S rRNA (uracil1939-C5)-methyltransferase